MYVLTRILASLSLLIPLVTSGGFTKTCSQCIMHFELVCLCDIDENKYHISTLNLDTIIGNSRGHLTYPGSGYRDTCYAEELKLYKDGSMWLFAWCWIDDPEWENERKSSVELTHIITNRNGVLVAD